MSRPLASQSRFVVGLVHDLLTLACIMLALAGIAVWGIK